jgi:hypothetical protein
MNVTQGNWPTACGPISPSGQQAANWRMYFRFVYEKSFISGNSARRSVASRSMTLTPTLPLLALEDLTADTPVEPDQLLVDREHGVRACSPDLSLKASKQLGIIIRERRGADHCLQS